MKKIPIYLFLTLITVVLAACTTDLDKIIEELAPKEETAIAGEFMSQFEEQDFDFFQKNIHSKLKEKVTTQKLEHAHSYFRKGKYISRKLIGYRGHILNGNWSGTFAYEYQFSDGWNVVNIALTKEDNEFKVTSVHVTQTENSQRALNAFTFKNKSIIHYLIFIFAILVPIFILVTLVACIRTPVPKRKWLWVLFILVGFITTKLNWTTGQIYINPLSFQFFGAGFVGGHGPWILSVAIPLGATIFWFKRKAWLGKAQQE